MMDGVRRRIVRVRPVPLSALPRRSSDEKSAIHGWRKKALRCNTCRVDFPGAAEHRAHFRSDLHRANLKRRAEGLEPLTEDLLAVPL